MAESSVGDASVPRAELVEWRERFGLVAGITERGAGEGFSLGFWTGEPVGVVMGRWQALRDAFRPGFGALQKAHQVHGTAVLWHQGVGQGWHVADAGDGHATTQSGLLLAVTVADCIPVYLTTSDGRAVALLHAGWRGTAAGVLEAGVRALLAASNGSPRDVVMHCGVGICGACYEVGEEVASAVLGEGASRGKQRLDLRAALCRRAEALGVGEVTVSPLCSSCHRDRFFSHRASVGKDGRMVAYLGIPKPASL
ncbi:MAG: laccase domain-containing protein [Gemmatimonadetes bacterium]|nr:laccase domain-containing protein [Gemmatimonadota bacterium]